MILVKAGVSLIGLKGPVFYALIMMANLAGNNYDKDITVTSTYEGIHSEGSLHPCGYAADVRTWTFTTMQVSRIYTYLSNNLGPDYDVVWEKDHLHIEYDKGKELCGKY